MRILIVDDQNAIRSYINDCFKAFGFSDVNQAVNGVQALEFCRKVLPDVITLDWNMPLMDGLDFLKELRAMQGGDKPVVIFCSTEGRQKKIDEVMAAGANTYITKPVDINILRSELVSLKLLP